AQLQRVRQLARRGPDTRSELRSTYGPGHHGPDTYLQTDHGLQLVSDNGPAADCSRPLGRIDEIVYTRAPFQDVQSCSAAFDPGPHVAAPARRLPARSAAAGRAGGRAAQAGPDPPGRAARARPAGRGAAGAAGAAT